jgi:(R,R)-butanediol dehydrogenase/meso-butanediol dehydrogenase/diacetyl reductase
MHLVRIHGVDTLSIDTVPEPNPGPHDIVVKIAACGICGSDLSYAKYGWRRADGEPFPLGHEAAGTVVTVGAAVEGIKLGMRVLVDPTAEAGNVIGNGGTEGAFCDLLLLRNAKLGRHVLQIPDNMPMRRAALIEPLAVALHGVNRGEVTRTSKVVVFGAGPIGLGAVFWLKRRGVSNIVAVDISDDRLSYARKLGATAVINPITENLRERLNELHGPGLSVLGEATVGTDIFLDMAGAESVIADVIAMAQYHARLIITAVYPKPVTVDLLKALMKELYITTAGGYPTELREVLEELKDVDDAALASYTSHVFPYDRFLEAFALAKTSVSAKVMIEFG